MGRLRGSGELRGFPGAFVSWKVRHKQKIMKTPARNRVLESHRHSRRTAVVSHAWDTMSGRARFGFGEASGGVGEASVAGKRHESCAVRCDKSLAAVSRSLGRPSKTGHGTMRAKDT